MLVNVGQGERSAAEAGASGGEGGFASEPCNESVSIIQHALLPLPRCGGFMGCRLCRRPLDSKICIFDVVFIEFHWILVNFIGKSNIGRWMNRISWIWYRFL